MPFDNVHAIQSGTTLLKFDSLESGSFLKLDGNNICGELDIGLASNPPSGKCKVTNIYVNPTTGKLVVEYNDIPV